MLLLTSTSLQPLVQAHSQAPGLTDPAHMGVWVLARAAVYLSGFTMNAPKTLLGISVRNCCKDIPEIAGTLGGLLGLVGQCGTFVGSYFLSLLLKSHPTYHLASLLPPELLPWVPGPLRRLLLDPVFQSWELFPWIYVLSCLCSCLLLALPSYFEYSLYRSKLTAKLKIQ